MENYLRHIYNLEREADGWVSNTRLAERLGVSKPTVTSMFDALAERDLIEREKYRPVRLTEEGRTTALDVVRKHRLVEALLVEVFEYDLSEVDSEADVLEHHVSDRLCREVERVLGMPELDPHGDPIPDANLDVHDEKATLSLVEAPEGSQVEVTRILSHDDETLDYLVSAGIEPTASLVLEEKTPVGLITVAVSETDRQTSLPESVAAEVLVALVDD